MFRENGLVIENRNVAPDHYVLKIRSQKISKNAKPGQFVQILCDNAHDPLLPRPFSFLTASANDFSILYQVVGKGTKILSKLKKGDKLWATGPLGNGFMEEGVRGKGKGVRIKGERSLLLVGGGVGIPPLYHLAQVLVEKRKISRKQIHIFLGARDKSLLLCEKEFKKLGVELHLATDNGSKGKKGFVTELLEDYLHRTMSSVSSPRRRGSSLSVDSRLRGNDSFLEGVRIFTCGPTPMLKTASMISQKYKVPCEVSVEVPMACGFGACLGCAIKLKGRSGSGHRFAMACSEGPVFQAAELLWD